KVWLSVRGHHPPGFPAQRWADLRRRVLFHPERGVLRPPGAVQKSKAVRRESPYRDTLKNKTGFFDAEEAFQRYLFFCLGQLFLAGRLQRIKSTAARMATRNSVTGKASQMPVIPPSQASPKARGRITKKPRSREMAWAGRG